MSKYVDIDVLVSDIAKEPGYKFIKPELISGLRNYPTADVKPVLRGEWIWDGYYKCSNCGNRLEYNKYIDGYIFKKFCDECGADMRDADINVLNKESECNDY